MVAEVIVDVSNSNVDKIFDYQLGQEIPVGSRVLVPFGNRNIEGYIIGIKETSDYDKELKSVVKMMDEKPLIKPELIGLCHKMKEQYNLRMVDCVRLVIPAQLRNNKTKEVRQYFVKLTENGLANVTIKTNASAQRGIIKDLTDNGVLAFSRLTEKYGNGALNKLIEMGVVEKFYETKERTPLSLKTKTAVKKVVLNAQQEKVLSTIISKNYGTFLLHGVTGSGKTEIYLHLIDEVLSHGKTAIMLVPEISLTPQVVNQFINRFGEHIAVLHSGLSDGEKFDQWQKIYENKAKIVVGARSAIFAPLENLGAIIIDEEHDNSYISETNPRYITSEVAEMRREYNKCPLILGSATPSIESYYDAVHDKYTLLELPVRANNKNMPTIELVDMCSEFRSGNSSGFSGRLLEELSEVVKNKSQAMLFINRRGYSSFLMCKTCGYIPKCQDCDVPLVYHQHDNELKCHYCGKRYRVMTKCPECGSTDLKLGNTGTEKVVHELKEMFPGVKILRMDNDTTRTKDAHAKILKEFSESKPAILVGTQMIAKGHDFSEVTLVGILDADLSLYFCDFRSTEKTFQLVTQVAGRAGRDKLEGKVVLQTYFPKHFVYQLAANYDYKRFYEKEINLREVTNFPPFAKVVRVLLSSESDDIAKQTTHELFQKLKELRVEYGKKFYFLEAMKSPVGRIKSKFRYQVVMRFSIDEEEAILKKIYDIVNEIKQQKVTVFLETNPLSLS